VALICPPLWDCNIEHTIQGLKIDRHSIVKDFPYEEPWSASSVSPVEDDQETIGPRMNTN
jgi:hypothetical protein